MEEKETKGEGKNNKEKTKVAKYRKWKRRKEWRGEKRKEKGKIRRNGKERKASKKARKSKEKRWTRGNEKKREIVEENNRYRFDGIKNKT